MAVPPDMLAMIKKDRAGATPPAPAATPDAGYNGMSAPEAPPMGAPMATPEPKLGEKESASINVQTAMDLLEQALPKIGSDSEEGKAIMAAVTGLTKLFGKREAKSRELMPAEIMNMISSLPQAGGANPEQRVAAQAPVPGTATPPLPM
jgi:hypothetical protein